MITLSKFSKIAAMVVTVVITSSATSFAQDAYKKYYTNTDWQFNAPFSSNFTKRASGWGMSTEGGYFVTPRVGIGMFIAFSSNHKYVDTQTIQISETSSLTTNQQRTLFQIPFGATVRYKFIPESMCDPYIAMKIGANYTQLSSFISTYKLTDKTWGFYVSPEIGTNIWFTPNKNIGVHMALYYGFSTNKGAVLNGNVNNINNLGFRLGIAF